MNTSDSFAMESLSQVFEYIENRRDDYVDRLIDYVRRPSISAHGVGIAEVADYIADIMNDIGIESRVIPTAGWPMVFGERLLQAGARVRAPVGDRVHRSVHVEEGDGVVGGVHALRRARRQVREDRKSVV